MRSEIIRRQQNDTRNNLTKVGFLFFFLLPLPFVKLTASISGAALLGVLICLFGVFAHKYYLDKYILTVSIFFIFGELLALLICEDVSRTVTFSIQKLIVVLVIFPTIMYFLNSDEKLKQGITGYKVGCLVSACFSLLAYMLGISIPFVATKFSTGRLTVAGMGPNVIARMFCIGAFIAFYQAQVSVGKQKIKNYVEYIVFTLAIMATVSTSGYALLLLGSIILYLKYNEGVHRKGILKIIVVFVCVIALLVFLYNRVPFVRSQVEKFVVREELNRVMDEESEGFSLHGRLEGLGSYSSDAIKHSITGVGYGCSSFLYGRTIHFPILASLIETGIFGLVSCICLYFFPILVSIRIWNNKKYAVFGIISLVMTLGDMVQPNPNYVFSWFGIFLSISAYRIMTKEQHGEIDNENSVYSQ